MSEMEQVIESEDPLVGVKALTGVYPGMNRPSKGRRRVRGLGHIESNCFHVMSRTCGGAVFFDETEKEALLRVMKRLSAFCGVKLLTYCIMGNHFHALVRIPKREVWLAERFGGAEGEEKLLRHLRLLYSKAFVQALREDLAQLRSQGMGALAEARLAAFKARMGDVSEWMREVKVRFSRWYNKRHERKGTLWMGPFKSVLVEGSRGQDASAKNQADALKVMAAYIDLNPVRAGLVTGAEEYRWSGWGEALMGEKEAVAGLCDVVGCGVSQWESRGKGAYGSWVGERRKDEDEDAMGKVSLLRRVRAFSAGVAIGSAGFVEAVFGDRRDLFGAKRKAGARPVDGGGGLLSGTICTLRALRQ
jgi:putative transposase